MSAISPTCRAALRALQRARQDELLEGDDAAAPAVTLGTGGGSNVSSTTVRDTTPSTNLAALEEHYTLRPPRERNFMETEAAIAAVLASGGCAGVDTEGVVAGKRKFHPSRGGCGALAAELVTALFKVSRRLCGKSVRATFGVQNCYRALRGIVNRVAVTPCLETITIG